MSIFHGHNYLYIYKKNSMRKCLDLKNKEEEFNSLMAGRKSENPKRKVDSTINTNVRVLFDKKRWRLQKYSKKFKLQQLEERRRRTALHKYHKELRKENPDFRKGLATDEELKIKDERKKKKKLSAYQAAQLEFERKQQEKQQQKEDMLRRKQEKDEALKRYQLNRTERYKKLSKKTCKGQPVMKDRMQMLLEKIQKQM